MSTPNNTLRQRGPKEQPKANGDTRVKELLDDTVLSAQQTAPSEWDYKLALAIITALAFGTRFFGINHPNEVVFDEVHFGKVGNLIAYDCRTRLTLRSVCILLPPTHLLLRRPSTLGQAPLRFRWLAGGLRRRLQIREHRRLVYYQQCPVCRLPISSGTARLAHSPNCVPNHVGVWLLLASLRSLRLLGPLR